MIEIPFFNFCQGMFSTKFVDTFFDHYVELTITNCYNNTVRRINSIISNINKLDIRKYPKNKKYQVNGFREANLIIDYVEKHKPEFACVVISDDHLIRHQLHKITMTGCNINTYDYTNGHYLIDDDYYDFGLTVTTQHLTQPVTYVQLMKNSFGDIQSQAI